MTMRADSIRVMCPLFHEGEGGSTPTSALSLWIEPIDLERARLLNRLWHSRMPRFGTGCIKNQPLPCYAATFAGRIYAVAIWSNPEARKLPQRKWLELRRLAIAPDAPRNSASRMLRIMALIVRRQRPCVERLISYQDTEAHTGAIYAAAGWTKTILSIGPDWNAPTRPRPPSQSKAPKQRWEKVLCPSA
jgi:hypothetical protein